MASAKRRAPCGKTPEDRSCDRLSGVGKRKGEGARRHLVRRTPQTLFRISHTPDQGDVMTARVAATAGPPETIARTQADQGLRCVTGPQNASKGARVMARGVASGD